MTLIRPPSKNPCLKKTFWVLTPIKQLNLRIISISISLETFSCNNGSQICKKTWDYQDNHRPIDLLPLLGKTMQEVILKSIQYHLKGKQYRFKYLHPIHNFAIVQVFNNVFQIKMSPLLIFVMFLRLSLRSLWTSVEDDKNWKWEHDPTSSIVIK